MRCQLAALLVLASVAAPSVLAQGRPLRLFLSTVGLSDVSDPQSSAADPTAELGINPSLVMPLNESRRLYVWAQITPPGTPNNATYNNVTFRVEVAGAGGQMAGFQFWNYTNGTYGNGTGRWQQFSQSGDATSASFTGSAVVTGAGISNTAASHNFDRQYRRFASNGSTRIDCTILGQIDIAGTLPSVLQVSIAVTPGAPIHRGWGDEFDVDNPIPEARIQIVPEPAGVLGILLAVLTLRRR